MTQEEYEYRCSECGSVVEAETKVCPKCGANLVDAGGSKVESPPPDVLTPEWAKNIERQLVELQSKIPNTDVISKNFWKRAWAIYWHLFAAGIIVLLGIFFLSLLLKACIG